jgi:ribosomal protein S18 acetylase RimI-like enzyme
MQYDTSTAVLDPPSTGLDLEPARWDDMTDVVEIIRSSASWYEDIVEPEDFSEHLVDRDWARENFRRRDFFVARLEDKVVGTVTLQDVGEDHVYLGYVCLHEDQVGNGFGRDLLDFARDETRRRGRKSMVLIAHPEATWACRAYEKYGFEVIGRDRDRILAWEDGWLEPFYEEGFHLLQYRV